MCCTLLDGIAQLDQPLTETPFVSNRHFVTFGGVGVQQPHDVHGNVPIDSAQATHHRQIIAPVGVWGSHDNTPALLRTTNLIASRMTRHSFFAISDSSPSRSHNAAPVRRT